MDPRSGEPATDVATAPALQLGSQRWEPVDPSTGLLRLLDVIRRSWSPATCDPDDEWDPVNPGRGQCGPTALVVQDWLGGDLVCAEVHVDGQRTGHHWWNRLPGGADLDLTRDQFRDGEVLTAGVVVARRPGTDPRRCVDQYRLLSARVRSTWGG